MTDHSTTKHDPGTPGLADFKALLDMLQRASNDEQRIRLLAAAACAYGLSLPLANRLAGLR